MCSAACPFLIIDDIIFRGSAGHRSSDFPRLECVSEHREDVRVRVSVRAHIAAYFCAHVLVSSLGCGLLEGQIINR